jgi:hypothetical protein
MLLDPNARPVIGHRGNRAHAPENTLESLQEAVALGGDAVEFGVQVSSDGVLLFMHGLTIDRTTSGSGAVATQTFAALRAHDAGARFTTDRGRTCPWRARGVVIPTFDAVVEALPSTLPLILELTRPPRPWHFTPPLFDMACRSVYSWPVSKPPAHGHRAGMASRSAPARPMSFDCFCRRSSVARYRRRGIRRSAFRPCTTAIRCRSPRLRVPCERRVWSRTFGR